MAKLVSIVEQRTEHEPTALVVDRNPESRVSLCQLLAESQIRTVATTNTVDALRVLQNQQIDVLICEDLGGFHSVEVFEACEALFPSVRRVYLARKAAAELHCQIIVRGHVHATIGEFMHPVDVRDLIVSLLRR